MATFTYHAYQTVDECGYNVQVWLTVHPTQDVPAERHRECRLNYKSDKQFIIF